MKLCKTACLIIMLLASFVLSTNGQQHAAPELKEVINTLKNLQSYSFESEVNVIFPNGKRQQSNMVMCMDKPRHRMFYSNEDQTLLVTDKWAFQAYHRTRKASVFDVVKYNKKYKEALPELQELFANDIMSLYIDSVLMKHARVRAVKKDGNRVTYELSFPDDILIKAMTIVFNTASGLPDKITMKTFQASAAGGYDKSKGGMTVETVCRNYTAQLPEQKLDPLHYFRVSGGKATLLQYKNYRLTTIL